MEKIIINVACVRAQSLPTLFDPTDCSLPGSSIRGIFQARILEWVAIPFSRGEDPLEKTRSISKIRESINCEGGDRRVRHIF